jgi:hypothetical protein
VIAVPEFSTVLAPAATALLGALFFAMGAALQQYEAAGTGRASLVGRLRTLAVRPRWLLGGVSIAAGTGLHILALGLGPLTIVQPMGVASLLFALPVAALLHGRRVRGAELAAAGAVAAGLIAFVLLVPAPRRPPRLDDSGALWLLSVAAALAVICWVMTRTAGRRTPATREPATREPATGPTGSPAMGTLATAALAGAAGVMFGLTSTLARVVADAAGRDPAAVLHWFTAAAALIAVVALALLQAAYAGRRFGVAFASVQVADPLSAVTAGALLLGEPVPTNAGAGVAAAALIVAGTIALARTSPIVAPPASQVPSKADIPPPGETALPPGETAPPSGETVTPTHGGSARCPHP